MNEVNAVFEDLLEDAATDPVRELLEDEDTAYLYLMERWLADAVAKLRDTRREADLTQQDVAERLGTKQPAIARLERDHEGRFSLRRFAEYALACNALPLDVVLKPTEDLRRYVMRDSNAPLSEKAYDAWRNGIVHGTASVAPTASHGAPLSWTVADFEPFLPEYNEPSVAKKTAQETPEAVPRGKPEAKREPKQIAA